MKTTNDFRQIVLDETPLIDVRAPIEYEKGAFLNSVNFPIMNDEERHLVGICYKEKGNEEATRLGYQLVSGKLKEERVKNWIDHLKDHPHALLYCFRGGSRSRITQEWIYEATGKEITRLEGGYKAFRNFLMDALNPEVIKSIPILIGGYTGTGKTSLLKQFKQTIDLEGIANHRGSSFGNYVTPQPTQINFENNLAYALIQHEHSKHQYMFLEDEGNNIGRCFLPKPLAAYFNSGNLVILESTFDERVQNTLTEYVIDSQKEHIDYYGHENGFAAWTSYIQTSIDKIQKRLGHERYSKVSKAFKEALSYQENTGQIDQHTQWIEQLLKEYYDPMYEYQIQKTTKKILFKGNKDEVTDFLQKHYTGQLI